MTRSREEILNELDGVSLALHRLSSKVEYLIDELDPNWRKRREMAALKSSRAWPGQSPPEWSDEDDDKDLVMR